MPISSVMDQPHPLPDLSTLDVGEKDRLIRSLHAQNVEMWDLIQALTAKVAELSGKVTELEGRLALNSRNSSKPPSSDGIKRPSPAPKSLREPSGRPSGGQKGHAGKTLKKVEVPDHVVDHPTSANCDECGQALPPGDVVETRQVFDIPPQHIEVTEHRVYAAVCGCGKHHRSEFPSSLVSASQYGSRLKAWCAWMVFHHMMPLARTAELARSLWHIPLSDGSVKRFTREAAALLAPTTKQIGEAMVQAPVAHADETGIHVAGQLFWMHAMVSTVLTWVGSHAKRGSEAFAALGLLPLYVGTLIHDGLQAYRNLQCQHGLCNAHHLRELMFLYEQMKQTWAKEMFDLLCEANRETQLIDGVLAADRLRHFRYRYARLLVKGRRANPRTASSGKRGRTAQSKGFNLLHRLRIHADDVWRFASDPNVPFTNNLAEQAIRMPKVKEKVSGGFRTESGLSDFCTVRSYLHTLQKQGINLFSSLEQAFNGNVPQPRFA